MGLRVSVPVLPGVRLSGPPNKPVRPWHWAAVIAALVVVAGCASGEGPPAEATSFAYTTTQPPSPPPPPVPPAQAQPAASQCSPHYSGACVPIADDVDCERGGGNGPAYVQGPVNVVDKDIYGLDHNSDGVGCESPVVNAGPEDLSECHPNYSGACVPIASEVDCEGGGGNGPEYVRGPVNVVGDDIYGLDANGNGIGCEPDVNAGPEEENLVISDDCEAVNRAQPPMRKRPTNPRPAEPPPTDSSPLEPLPVEPLPVEPLPVEPPQADSSPAEPSSADSSPIAL